jgi:hypothetical protein
VKSRLAAAAVLAIAALAGCTPAVTASGHAAAPLPSVNAAVSSAEPAWGQGWVTSDGPLPVLRPDAAANERLADAMAAAAPYRWTGSQEECLNETWMKISGFDNFWRSGEGLSRGIAGLGGYVADPSFPADPSVRDEQALGWWNARPGIQIAAGLTDIEVFWGTPCAEWSREAQVSPGSYPPPADYASPGRAGRRGRLDFAVRGGRLVLAAGVLQDMCGAPALPAADAPPACSWLTSRTSWPLT